MTNRLELHELLCDILGSRQVYNQPPSSVRMKYPAIVYSRSNIKNRFANDSVYLQNTFYDITVIDKDPDNTIVDKMSKLPKIRYDRCYISDNLYHYVFELFY